MSGAITPSDGGLVGVAVGVLTEDKFESGHDWDSFCHRGSSLAGNLRQWVKTRTVTNTNTPLNPTGSVDAIDLAHCALHGTF